VPVWMKDSILELIQLFISWQISFQFKSRPGAQGSRLAVLQHVHRGNRSYIIYRFIAKDSTGTHVHQLQPRTIRCRNRSNAHPWPYSPAHMAHHVDDSMRTRLQHGGRRVSTGNDFPGTERRVGVGSARAARPRGELTKQTRFTHRGACPRAALCVCARV
jgi:hypothetical protein